MSALLAGVEAPEINLSGVDGAKFSLRDALKKAPALAAFFKVSCPVCQMAFPYLERLFQAYGKQGKAKVIGVSQDNASDTREFNREFGVTFPVLLDEKNYAVSRAYGLTNVPTLFLISPAGEIEMTLVSWSKAEMEELGRRLAEINGTPAAEIFRRGEKVPEFRPG
ncbi:MAG TPA: TlpA disulfide reductase family protein [Terriglobales bacterium]|nr:TlpA disulfide reductase family protein [Terriglobales bacterium]